MASPVGTLSSCSTQRDHWNGGDRDDLRSGCRSITPTRHTRRASSRSTCQSGGSTDCSRRAAEDAESIRHHEKPTRNTEGLSRIRVGVRVRPAFSSEVLSGYRPAVTVSNVTTAVQRACEDRKYLREEGNGSIENGFEHEATGTSLKQACVELKMSNWRRRRFSFDYAFDAACQQDEIYQSLAAPVVEGCLVGLNGLIMAHGQTASGKSHTMGILRGIDISEVDPGPSIAQEPSLLQGTQRNTTDRERAGADLDTGCTARGYRKPSSVQYYSHNQVDPGVIPRALSRVFDHESRSVDASVKVKVSLLQIYNETVQDLLSPATPFGRESAGLNVRENPSVGFFVEGLLERAVRSHEEAAALINSGLQQRTTARTSKNDISSRSHTVLTITLEQGSDLEVFPLASRVDAATVSTRHAGDRSRSKLVLVDLAGSERSKRSSAYSQEESEADRLREAGFINQSLSALGNVVAALGKAEVDRPHIPFRDSKLTRILADTLGGNANAALIATVGPAPQNQAESLSTLVFASRCMRVQGRPEKHEDCADIDINLRLQAQLSSMQREFCRREALQQSRYETVAQELEYARNKATSARFSGRSTDTECRALVANFTTDKIPSGRSATNRCRVSASVCGDKSTTSETPKHNSATATASATDTSTSSSPDRRTDETASTDGGERRASTDRGNSSHKAMEDIVGSVGTFPLDSGGGGRATAGVGHELVAWEMLGAAMRTLEVVGQMGGEVVRQAREARQDSDAARREATMEQPRPPAPPSEASTMAEATTETDEYTARLSRAQISRRLEHLRKLCEGQWKEAGAILSATIRDTTRFHQMLRTEAIERHRQETKARRLRGALRHLLEDGQSLDCADFTPAPHRRPEEQRGSTTEPNPPSCSSDVGATDREQGYGSCIGQQADNLSGTREWVNVDADGMGRAHSAVVTSCGNDGAHGRSESADWISHGVDEGSDLVTDPAVVENLRKFRR